MMKTTMLFSGYFFCFFIFIAYSCACAQELTIHEMDDYINPFLFNKGKFDGKKKYAFCTLRAQSGLIVNYQYRDDFSKPKLLYAKAISSIYLSKFQLNWKITGLSPSVNGERIKNFSSKVQIGRYLTIGRSGNSRKLDGRYQISWNYYYSIRGGGDGLYSRLTNDFTIDLDLRLASLAKSKFIKRILPVSGGVFFSRNFDFNDNYYGATYSFELFGINDKFYSILSLGGGRRNFQNKDEWSIYKGELRFRLKTQLPYSYLVLAVSYAKDMINNKSNIETSLFVDVGAISRFIPKPKKSQNSQ